MSGYEKVANFMTNHDEMAVFKRFKFLNNLNALYLQAELENLEGDMKGYMKAGFPPGTSDSDEESLPKHGDSDDVDIADSAVSGIDICDASSTTSVTTQGQTITSQNTTSVIGSPGSIQLQNRSPTSPPSKAVVDWWYLANQDENQDAWNTMLTARQKLKEYNKTLLIQKHLYSIPPPHKHDLEFLQTWLQSTTMGNLPIWGVDGDIWKNSSSGDLIALSPSKCEDSLGLFVLESTSTWWHSCIGRRLKKPVDEEMQYLEYKNKRVLRVADGLSSVLFSLFLVASIMILHFVASTIVRLIVVAIFTTLFPFALILVTNARKVEVFAGTTAFAAVQVVFVGSTSAILAN
ncbi:hypothetical protein HYFRA_00010171 [Hymenoscyphus fraxineus]|uniref:DUF6594 domain-containing protein n=1 Tax=Hymenoscyphus fraxineus TaxID=746836 RepID=A0A9N9PTE6_9HELO|nr:hypothetical protein HYFRA_00010171 [Hymenoscyphus fraxineus]